MKNIQIKVCGQTNPTIINHCLNLDIDKVFADANIYSLNRSIFKSYITCQVKLYIVKNVLFQIKDPE